MNLKLGKYRHYKGGEYELIAIARREGSQEPMAVYQALAGEKILWTRPVKEFIAEVEEPSLNYKGPRFTYLGD